MTHILILWDDNPIGSPARFFFYPQRKSSALYERRYISILARIGKLMESSKSPEKPAGNKSLLLELKKRQAWGLILLALLVVTFSVKRVGLHSIFPPGWWRIW